MNISVLNNLSVKLQNISQLYYKQVYVYEYERGNSVEYFSQANHYPLMNINLLLSERIKTVAQKRRPYKVAEILNELINKVDSEIVCIDYYEMLFEPSLGVNPFDLFTNLSRNKTLIITWRGRIEGDYFIYAEPGHPEYTKYSTKDAIVIK
ncbi:BREX-3 system P-loop-containing protein BrxF [Planococcus donghaensis]|uniref:BREX-3 system P-loop-containing protein BrxF n=1 Tax=Planococcus donghaensis TaxID=414778 RepID=A0A1C7EDF9_9BACL|nr:BREX-3 system P-loop-containing protein BrxF [Planococcus donghaensis]ANU22004.1 hypothetical protein BCM40_01025 [Planococcus donghaensis]